MNRFFQTKLGSIYYNLALSVGVGVEEILVRLTLKLRVRIFGRLFLCRSFQDTDIAYNTPRCKSFIGRTMLIEMIVEYIGCIIAALVTFFNQQSFLQ